MNNAPTTRSKYFGRSWIDAIYVKRNKTSNLNENRFLEVTNIM